MRLPRGRVYAIGVRTYASWREDRTLRLGAGLAYYVLFAVVPLLALTAALGEWLFGGIDMQAYLAERLARFNVVDAEAAGAAITDELTRRSIQTSFGLIGVASLIFASSLVFLALTDAINVIWHVPVGSGVWNSVRRRLIAFLMVLTTGAVMVASFAVSAITGAAEALIPGDVEVLEQLADLFAAIASWVLLAAVLAMLFSFLSPVRVPWLVAVPAGAATAILLVLGTMAAGWYFSNIGGSSISGALGAMLAGLTWVYYEAQILLGGVQLTKVLTTTDRSSHVTATERSG